MVVLQEKVVKNGRLIGLSILVVILAVLNVLTYVNMQNQISVLNYEKNFLERKLDMLQISYNELNSSFNTLYARYFELLNQYENLSRDYITLYSRYEDLNGRYITLQVSYQNLQSNFNSLMKSYDSLQIELEVEKTLQIGNSLESYYDYLRQELGFEGVKHWSSTYTESYWQMEADFAAKLALHDLGFSYWPDLEKNYYEIVGEYSYDTAKRKIDQVIALIGIKTYDTPTEKIKKTLSFINQYIHYENDIDDIFLAPVETLAYRSGDCEDFSILVATLLEAEGIDSAIGFFTNGNGEYHAMVLVHLEELTGFSYHYFSDLTNLGLKEGKWIVIEPQRTIDQQGDEWIEQWTLLVAAPLNPS
jgi:predicted transglutaminase-like cysteine proteinase/archaellum component FlaC